MRQDSWEEFAFPRAAGKAFQKNGLAIVLATVLGFALLFWAARSLAAAGGEGFYAVLSHNAMVAIFLPAFLFPLFSIAIGLRRYWQTVGGAPVRPASCTRLVPSCTPGRYVREVSVSVRPTWAGDPGRPSSGTCRVPSCIPDSSSPVPRFASAPPAPCRLPPSLPLIRTLASGRPPLRAGPSRESGGNCSA